jgi:hypothetical protein
MYTLLPSSGLSASPCKKFEPTINLHISIV